MHPPPHLGIGAGARASGLRVPPLSGTCASEARSCPRRSSRRGESERREPTREMFGQNLYQILKKKNNVKKFDLRDATGLELSESLMTGSLTPPTDVFALPPTHNYRIRLRWSPPMEKKEAPTVETASGLAGRSPRTFSRRRGIGPPSGRWGPAKWLPHNNGYSPRNNTDGE